jgi:hypothetical protein
VSELRACRHAFEEKTSVRARLMRRPADGAPAPSAPVVPAPIVAPRVGRPRRRSRSEDNGERQNQEAESADGGELRRMNALRRCAVAHASAESGRAGGWRHSLLQYQRPFCRLAPASSTIMGRRRAAGG